VKVITALLLAVAPISPWRQKFVTAALYSLRFIMRHVITCN